MKFEGFKAQIVDTIKSEHKKDATKYMSEKQMFDFWQAGRLPEAVIDYIESIIKFDWNKCLRESVNLK